MRGEVSAHVLSLAAQIEVRELGVAVLADGDLHRLRSEISCDHTIPDDVGDAAGAVQTIERHMAHSVESCVRVLQEDAGLRQAPATAEGQEA